MELYVLAMSASRKRKLNEKDMVDGMTLLQLTIPVNG
jgi:hypothetical protein